MFPTTSKNTKDNMNLSESKKNQMTQTECIVLDSPYIAIDGDSPSFMTNLKGNTTSSSTQEYDEQKLTRAFSFSDPKLSPGFEDYRRNYNNSDQFYFEVDNNSPSTPKFHRKNAFKTNTSIDFVDNQY